MKLAGIQNSKPKKKQFSMLQAVIVAHLCFLIFAVSPVYQGPSSHSAMTAAAKAEASNNLKQIISSYIKYHEENGGITEDLDGQSVVKHTSENSSGREGTNHDWVAVLAEYDRTLNEANHWILRRDKLARKVNSSERAKVVLDIDGENCSLNPSFKKSMLYCNVFAGIQVPEGADPSKIPVLYTAGLQADGEWHESAPHKRSGGQIGFMDGSVKNFKKIKEGDFFKWDDPTVPTLDLREAVNGVLLRHDGVDPFDGHRMKTEQKDNSGFLHSLFNSTQKEESRLGN